MQGGWENDESMETAASRETFEEAGVTGNIEVSISNLGFHNWLCSASFVHPNSN